MIIQNMRLKKMCQNYRVRLYGIIIHTAKSDPTRLYLTSLLTLYICKLNKKHVRTLSFSTQNVGLMIFLHFAH